MDCSTPGFPGGSVVKNLSADAGDTGSVPGLGRSPGEENGNPFLPAKFHGQRSLVGYSPWDCKELDVIYQLNNSNNNT